MKMGPLLSVTWDCPGKLLNSEPLCLTLKLASSPRRQRGVRGTRNHLPRDPAGGQSWRCPCRWLPTSWGQQRAASGCLGGCPRENPGVGVCVLRATGSGLSSLSSRACCWGWAQVLPGAPGQLMTDKGAGIKPAGTLKGDPHQGRWYMCCRSKHSSETLEGTSLEPRHLPLGGGSEAEVGRVQDAGGLLPCGYQARASGHLTPVVLWWFPGAWGGSEAGISGEAGWCPELGCRSCWPGFPSQCHPLCRQHCGKILETVSCRPQARPCAGLSRCCLTAPVRLQRQAACLSLSKGDRVR